MTESKDPQTHQKCPECGHNGCYTSWKDGGGFCHSCGFRTGGRDGNSEGLPDLFFDPAITSSKPEGYRGLRDSTVRIFGTTTGYVGDEPRRREYPYPSQVKYRYLPKDFTKNKGFVANELFGMDKFPPGGKTITIVEGEDDAPAAYEMLGEKNPVVSLPSASISSALVNNCGEYLRSFDQIVVCTDGDDAGKRAASRLATAFPNKVYLVDIGTKELKDPMDYHAAGKHREFFNLWMERKKYVPSGFWNTPAQFTDILDAKNTTVFYPTFSESLNDVIHGLPLGHLVVLTGPEGQGKTEVMRAFEIHMLRNYKDVNIGVLHMEESRKTCLESYACYELGTNVRRPDHTVPREDINRAVTNLTKGHNLFMFDFHIDEDPLDILDKVRYLSVACDCKVVFIDPIQQLAYGTRRDQTEEQVLSQISVQLERLATDLNICIVMTTHVNDDGQTRSSRMIGKSASVRIDLKRDHMSTDPEERNITYLSVSKNRPTGSTGYGGALKFDPFTFTLDEHNVTP